MFCSPGQAGEPPQTVECNTKEMIMQLDVFVHQNCRVKCLKQLGCKRKTNNHVLFITIGGLATSNSLMLGEKNNHAA